MLVLSRRPNEAVLIDGAITIEVLKIRGNRVTLGIKAPSDVRILRSETIESASNRSSMEFNGNESPVVFPRSPAGGNCG